MRWPKQEFHALPIIYTGSMESCGPTLTEVSNSLEQAAGAVWPSANLAIYVPFWLAHPFFLRKLLVWSANGNNNVDVGIYTQRGTKLVSSGSTAMGGVDVCQEFDVTDQWLYPGRYYWAVAINSTSGGTGRWAPSVGVSILQNMGVLQQASAFALPATATFATITTNFLPVVGMSKRATI